MRDAGRIAARPGGGSSFPEKEVEALNSIGRGLAWVLLAGCLALPAPALAAAAGPTSIGSFQQWSAWTNTDSSGLSCYVSSEPTSSKPDGVKRDPIFFLVVDRKGLGTKNEVQTLMGYPLKKDSKPSAAIDGKSYPMIADGSGAWLASPGDDAGFVAGLRKGKSLVVKGTSTRGTDTTDTYSLSGVTAALAAVEKACS
jgi:hypothetical protein